MSALTVCLPDNKHRRLFARGLDLLNKALG